MYNFSLKFFKKKQQQKTTETKTSGAVSNLRLSKASMKNTH